MDQKIINLLRKAKLNLFTNSLIFFGMCANKFKWGVEDFNNPSIEGFVVFNEKDLSKLESGIIHLNKFYLSKPDYTFNHLVYLICHELLHILNKHGIRRGDRIHHIWCVACDHVIEKYLQSLSNIIKPHQNRYNIVERLNQSLPLCSAEQAYEWLIKNERFIQIKIKLNDDNSNNPDVIQVFDQNNDLLFETISNMSGVDNKNDNVSQAIVHQIEQFVAEARATLENLKQKGSLPSALTTYLDEILKVEIPWDRLVEKAIKTNTIMKPDERSWRVLNKFYIPQNLTLPGYSLIEDTEGVGTLIIGVDSSGSISNTDLKKFASVIENSMKFFKTIHVLMHSVNVYDSKVFDKDNITQFYKFLKEEGFKDRGGTSHRHLFQKIESDFWEKDKDDLSMVISLTDCYSDIQYEYKNYNWIKNNLPLVFIITTNGSFLDLDKEIGDIIQIKINK